MFLTLEKLASELDSDLNAVLALVLDGHLPPPSIIGGRLVRWSTEALTRWSAVDCPKGQPMTRQQAYELRSTRLDERDEKMNQSDARYASDHPDTEKETE
ncbi:MAG: hypothetical protein WCJ35_21265 [Planctomycetota bacterium]